MRKSGPSGGRERLLVGFRLRAMSSRDWLLNNRCGAAADPAADDRAAASAAAAALLPTKLMLLLPMKVMLVPPMS